MVSYSIVSIMSPCDVFVRRRSITIFVMVIPIPMTIHQPKIMHRISNLPHSSDDPSLSQPSHHPIYHPSPGTSHRTRRLSLARSLWLVCGLQCRHVDGQFHCQTSYPLCFIEHDGETKICEFRVMSPYLFLPVCPSALFLSLL